MDEHSTSKMQTWIVVMLAWAILLLMFGIGYLVYTNNGKTVEPAVTTTDLTSACAEAVNTALAAQPAEDPVVCPTIETYDGYPNVRFDYPIDWEVFAHDIELANLAIIRLSADPLWLCAGCDGPGNALNISVERNTDAKSLDTVVAERYTQTHGYSAITKSTATFKGKTAVVVRGTLSGMGTGPIEEIVYVTPGTVVTATNHNFESDSDVNSAWQIVKASLDFSAIE